ncbi:MAG: glycosyltransferase family 2 protein [Bacteroidales bacterium]|nr:glycosyltransferase family 2 protein [Bacteroidales bacterium]
MSVPVLSVVIPCYNTAPYLETCLESVAGQTYRDIEVLCVDDASTDGTAALLRMWAEKDPRIRCIFFARNSGVSAARNAGLSAARGEFVYFLDSDDWIDPDYLAAMVREACKTGRGQVLNANYLKEYGEGHPALPGGRWGFIREEAGDYDPIQVQGWFQPLVWTRLYRRKYLEDNHILFPDVKGGAEDIYFTGLAEVLQEKSYIFCGPFHHYRQREGSFVHQGGEKGFYYLQSFRLLVEELGRRGIPTEGMKLFYAGPMLVDSEEKFDFIRSFLMEIEPQVSRHPEMYTGHDLLLLEAVCSSQDYAAFRARHNPNLAVEYIRQKMKGAR